jgi:hypothetical protein
LLYSFFNLSVGWGRRSTPGFGRSTGVKTRYTSYRRLGWSHGQFGRVPGRPTSKESLYRLSHPGLHRAGDDCKYSAGTESVLKLCPGRSHPEVSVYSDLFVGLADSSEEKSSSKTSVDTRYTALGKTEKTLTEEGLQTPTTPFAAPPYNETFGPFPPRRGITVIPRVTSFRTHVACPQTQYVSAMLHMFSF